jgi:hypothetical protein
LTAALLVQFGLVLAGQLVPPLNFPLRVAIKLGLLAVLPLSYLWLGIISRDELHHATLFVRNRVRVWRARK